MINKKKVVACSAISIGILIIILLFLFLPKEKNFINGIVYENVSLYSKPIEKESKIKLDIKKYTDVKILDSCVKNSKQWYKVKVNGKKGYILSEYIDYYKKDNSDMLLVADFSSHNMKNLFSNKNDIEAFLLKYNISYVYIRAGGRGYGEKGNFYTDEKYHEFKNACEYLGIEYGYYFLDEALTEAEIIAEVEFIDSFMKKNKSDLCTLPIALDIESHEGKGRCDDIWDTRSELVKRLIRKIDKLRI